MTLLGLDPGLAHTGWGVIHILPGGKARCSAYGTIRTSAGLPEEERLTLIYDRLGEITEEHKPEAGALETLYFAKNVRSALPVAQARGVLLLALRKRGVSVFHYTPLQIKQAVVGTGSAEKRQVQEMTKLLLGLRELPKPDHAADALAAALCLFHHQDYPS